MINAFYGLDNLDQVIWVNASLELSINNFEGRNYFAALDPNGRIIVNANIQQDGISKTMIWSKRGQLIHMATSSKQLLKAVFSAHSNLLALCYQDVDAGWEGFDECFFYSLDLKELGNIKLIKTATEVKDVINIRSKNQLISLEYSEADKCYQLLRLSLNNGELFEEKITQIDTPIWIGETGYPFEDKIIIIENKTPSNELIKTDIFIDNRSPRETKLGIESEEVAFFSADRSSLNDYCFLIANGDEMSLSLYSACKENFFFLELDNSEVDQLVFNKGEIFILSEQTINTYSSGEFNRRLESSEQPAPRIFKMCLNDNGTLVAVVLENERNSVKIWDRRSGRVLTKLVDQRLSNVANVSHFDDIFSIEFDRSGKRLLTTSDKTIKLWNINSYDNKTLFSPLGVVF